MYRANSRQLILTMFFSAAIGGFISGETAGALLGGSIGMFCYLLIARPAPSKGE